MNRNESTIVASVPAKRRRGLVIVVALVTVVIAAAFAVRVVQAAGKKKADASAVVEAPPLAVKTAAVVSAKVPDVVVFTGAVRPKNEVDVFTKAAGRIQSVKTDLGMQVKAGQVLAVVEQIEVALQHRQSSAQADAARAALESAQTNEESARVQLDRYRTLRAENAVPQAEFERIESAHKSAVTAVKSAKAQLAVAEAGAALQGKNVSNARITAPIDGVVSKMNVELGTQVAPGQPLFQIQDSSVLTVEGSVPGRDVLRIAVGGDAEVTAEEAPNVRVPAKVARVAPTLDPVTRRALVEVEMTDLSQGRLLPNMFATVSMKVGQERTALVIPQTAVITLATGSVVYVVRDGKAVSVVPELGAAFNGNVVIEAGLAEGDHVITSGDAGLRTGVAVTTGSAP